MACVSSWGKHVPGHTNGTTDLRQTEEGLLTQGFSLSLKLGTLPQSPRASMQIRLGHSLVTLHSVGNKHYDITVACNPLIKLQ